MFTRKPAGFSLVETLVAIALFAALAAGVAPLFGVAAKRNRDARLQTSATLGASQKLEELKGRDPGSLDRSPAGTLDADVPGYVDYLNTRGEAVGAGAAQRAEIAFVRRWSIEPLPAKPRVLVLQVLVIPSPAPASAPTGRRADGARIAGIARIPS
jgi:prepilin-type N-terminal cleavage/methylation domain-containing protein